MLNIIWLLMLLGGMAYGIATGQGEALSLGATQGAAQAVEMTVAMMGGMMLWCGILEVAQKSGLAQRLSDVLSVLLAPLFRGLKRTDAAMRAVCMNLASNVLGLGNAATTFGLEAMRELQKRNPTPARATNDMVALIVINCTAIQLLPTTLINLRIAAGSAAPLAIVGPSILATAGTMAAGVVMCLWAHRRR
jgi:spore maturation protein A